MEKLKKLEDNLERIMDIIGYEFTDIGLLYQAFTRKSYAEERKGYDNEVFELLGDRVLDFYVTKLIFDKFGMHKNAENNFGYFVTYQYKDEGDITKLKEKLVNKHMLASRIDKLGLHLYLLMGNGDIKNKLYEQESVKEDLFEAILGAVAIDCDYNPAILEEIVSRLLNVEYYLENGFSEEETDFISIVQEWNQRRNGCVPEYKYIKGEGLYKVVASLELKVDAEIYAAYGYGSNRGEARNDCARNMYFYLKNKNLLFTMRDELPVYIDLNNSVMCLNILHQKGYISNPDYEFSDERVLDDFFIDEGWKVSCSIDEVDTAYTFVANTKKEAKAMAAYGVLCELFHMHNKYDSDDIYAGCYECYDVSNDKDFDIVDFEDDYLR